MERILNLESYISTLPEPIENNGFNFNNEEGPNYNNDGYMRKKNPKLHSAQKEQTNSMRKAAQTKSRRKAAQKALTKSMRNLLPKNNTYTTNKERTNEFLYEAKQNEINKNSEENDWQLKRQMEGSDSSNGNRIAGPFSQEMRNLYRGNHRPYPNSNYPENNRMNTRTYQTMNGPVRLSGQEANNADNGIFPNNYAEEARQRELRHKKRQNNLERQIKQEEVSQKNKNLERYIKHEELVWEQKRQKYNKLRRETELPRTKRTNQKPEIKHYPVTDYTKYNENNNFTTRRSKRRSKANGKGSHLDF
jgi:hypothetical protein